MLDQTNPSVHHTALPRLLASNWIPSTHNRGDRSHLGQRLIRENDIVFNRDCVLNLRPDDRRGDDQASGQQSPCCTELLRIWMAGWVGSAKGVDTAGDGRAGGLNPLVEAGEIGKFAGIVCEGAHEPVRGISG